MSRLASILVLISCLGSFSCKQKPTPPTPPIPVNLMTVKTQRVFYYDKYPSTTVALSQVNLYAQVTGYITAIHFVEGSHVQKGQLLYTLDERLYLAAVDQARANLRVDSGNLKQQQQDADRYVYLKEHNAVATQLVDHQLIALQNAKDSVVAAQQQLKTALTNLTYSKIYAPFDGTIGISQVRLGNLISVGSTLLNTISTDDPMAVDFLVNESQLPHFEDIQMNKHPIDSLFTILLPDQTLYPNVGKILFIDRAVDPQTGAIDIRLAFPNPQYRLRPGMSTVVRVHNLDPAPQMVVPSRAVVEQMGEYFLFIAKDTIWKASGSAGGADGSAKKADSADKKDADTVEAPKLRAFQKKVQLGQTIGANVVVKSGVNPGDHIIVDGVQAVHEGSPISVGPAREGGGGDSTGRVASGRDGTGRKADSSKNK
jgi:membrane fusion protein (multidrug efflux system)